jgi:hypothetical protein
VRDPVLQRHHRLHRCTSRRKARKRAVAGGVDNASEVRRSRTGRDALFEQVEVQLLQPLPGFVAEVGEVGARFDDVGEGQGRQALEPARQPLRQHGLQTNDFSHRHAGGVKGWCHGTGAPTLQWQR